MAKGKRILVYFDELVMTLAKQYSATMDTRIYSPREILSSIQELHQVDAVEVVRCKDCKAYDKEVGYCEAMGFTCEMDDFCSYVERKDNG